MFKTILICHLQTIPKIGFSLAPKIAEIMADYILYDIDNIPETFKV